MSPTYELKVSGEDIGELFDVASILSLSESNQDPFRDGRVLWHKVQASRLRGEGEMGGY